MTGGHDFQKEKRRISMKIYEELKARGLIAQVTNEEEISKMVNEGKGNAWQM